MAGNTHKYPLILEWGEIIIASVPGGGGGTSILKVMGTCRWTGYDFAVINIGTVYLNRPNWLLVDYSVYHRVASQGFQPGSQPTVFMTGP